MQTKIVDIQNKGNVIKLSLGNITEDNFHGDDWNNYTDDIANHAPVYDKYVTGIANLIVPFEYSVRWCNKRSSLNEYRDGEEPLIEIVNSRGHVLNSLFLNQDYLAGSYIFNGEDFVVNSAKGKLQTGDIVRLYDGQELTVIDDYLVAVQKNAEYFRWAPLDWWDENLKYVRNVAGEPIGNEYYFSVKEFVQGGNESVR